MRSSSALVYSALLLLAVGSGSARLATPSFSSFENTTNEVEETGLTDSQERGCPADEGACSLKMELLRLTSRLVEGGYGLRLAPGVALVGTEKTRQLPSRLRPLALGRTSIGVFLSSLLAEYFGSLNLTLQVKESTLLNQFKQLGAQIWSSVTGTANSSFTGRKHKPAWVTVGTMAAVAFALLAALCGKALMASMLALALSALVALRAGGGGFGAAAAFHSPTGRVTQYEIISKPLAYATGPAHYTIEHDAHGAASMHSPPVYSYSKRELEDIKGE